MSESQTSKATYTQGYDSSVLATHQWRTVRNSAEYLLPHLKSNYHLLDIGSGAGTITCDFAAIVSKVTALEMSEEAISITREEAKRRNVALEYSVGDIHALPFDDSTFDVVHAHQVLQHVGDPVQALKEMKRVLKPGGFAAAMESDFSSHAWFPADQLLEEWRKLHISIARSNGGEPDAGRRLLDWAQQAGFTHVTPGAYTWCYATPDGRQYWGGMWEKRVIGLNFAKQAKIQGTSEDQLQAISRAWASWKNSANGYYMVPHGTLLAKK